MQVALIAVSFGLTLLSPVVYIQSILRGESRPHRTTRFVFLSITTLSTASLFANGSTVAVWIAAASTFQAFAIFGLSLRYGMGGRSRLDIACLAIAFAGIVLWQVTDDPGIAVAASILSDCVGAVPTFVKTWRMPETEAPLFYGIDAVSAVLILLAIRRWSVGEAAYPIYILLVNVSMVVLASRKSPNVRT